MKTHTASPSSWEFYTNSLKQSLGRALTQKECSKAMQAYINSVPWHDVAKELEVKGNE